ncbi:unnamed protein product [Protopolystoma xenopodis]|uniref:Uncharacterized protein n=1 Tax=Protopolystoma xenopodis TaxID=117903 RepID=A0A3S5CJX1_9PLAT|nr:unnamed protein product [Protopolystoma xenopodis]
MATSGRGRVSAPAALGSRRISTHPGWCARRLHDMATLHQQRRLSSALSLSLSLPLSLCLSVSLSLYLLINQSLGQRLSTS